MHQQHKINSRKIKARFGRLCDLRSGNGRSLYNYSGRSR